MSRRKGNLIILEEEKPDVCEYCGKVAELRPYGKDGANICFPCGMLPENKEETEKNCNRILFGNLIVKKLRDEK